MENDSPLPRGPRFGIGFLILLMTIVAFAATGPGALQRGSDWRPFFVIFTLIAPGLVLILVSLWQKYLRPR